MGFFDERSHGDEARIGVDESLVAVGGSVGHVVDSRVSEDAECGGELVEYRIVMGVLPVT